MRNPPPPKTPRVVTSSVILFFLLHAPVQLTAFRKIGNHELLEAVQPRHVLLQGGELPWRQATTIELYDWILGGEERKECSRSARNC